MDIGNLQGNSKEGTGYPTQKPIALYERIIKASSNPGGIVLDPFCGSGTTQIAAERLGRQWLGADLWEGSMHEVVLNRFREEGLLVDTINHIDEGQPTLFTIGDVKYTKVAPVRTDTLT